MAVDDLPGNELAFLRERVSSREDIEVLRLLCGSAERGWTVGAIASQLGMPEARVAGSLEHLREAILVMTAGRGAGRRFSYRPATAALDAAVATFMRLEPTQSVDATRAAWSGSVARDDGHAPPPTSHAC